MPRACVSVFCSSQWIFERCEGVVIWARGFKVLKFTISESVFEGVAGLVALRVYCFVLRGSEAILDKCRPPRPGKGVGSNKQTKKGRRRAAEEGGARGSGEGSGNGRDSWSNCFKQPKLMGKTGESKSNTLIASEGRGALGVESW